MHLRLGRPDDAFVCSMMMKHFIESTEYADTFDASYAFRFADAHLRSNDGITILAGETPIGMLAAKISAHPFIPIRTATELCWWVEPEHRKSGAGIELLNAYEHWATHVVKAKLITLASLNNERVDKIYERMGYTKTEHSWTKRL